MVILNKRFLSSIKDIEELIRENKSYIFSKYPITEIGIFGSYLKGEQAPDSDLDILIDYDRRKKFSLFDFIGLQEYLSKLLGLEIDLALKRHLKTAIGYYILKVVRYI